MKISNNKKLFKCEVIIKMVSYIYTYTFRELQEAKKLLIKSKRKFILKVTPLTDEEAENYLKEKEMGLKEKPEKTNGDETPKEETKGKKSFTLISERAKKIYRKGEEKWTDAIKRATDELRKEGFI